MTAAVYSQVMNVKRIGWALKSRQIKRELANTTLEAMWEECTTHARHCGWGDVPDPAVGTSDYKWRAPWNPRPAKKKRK